MGKQSGKGGGGEGNAVFQLMIISESRLGETVKCSSDKSTFYILSEIFLSDSGKLV